MLILKRFIATANASSVATTSKYPARKEAIWKACQNYLKKPVLLLLQLNNLDSATQLEVHKRLKALNFSLKTPKTGVLKAALKDRRTLRVLEPAITGFTAVAVGSWNPEYIRNALAFIATQPKILLVGGKYFDSAFSPEGLQESLNHLTTQKDTMSNLVSLMQSPMNYLVSTMQSPQMCLASMLDYRSEHFEDLEADSTDPQ